MILIIINGLPATGKTTLARPLSEKLEIPLIAKDTIKEFLFNTLGTKDRSWSRTLGKVSNDFIYELTDILLADGQSLMIENAFEKSFAKQKLERIIDRHKPKVVELYCHSDSSVRRQRFVNRNESGSRHKGHADYENYLHETEIEPVEKYAPLALGYTIKIDTTYEMNLEQIIASIKTID